MTWKGDVGEGAALNLNTHIVRMFVDVAVPILENHYSILLKGATPYHLNGLELIVSIDLIESISKDKIQSKSTGV